MRYIGPFFRMNKLSPTEINGQLFHLSKEAIRTLVLESKCGVVDSIKNYKKTSSTIDITTRSNFSPLLCMYRKSSPNYIHSKNYNGFDEDSFRKDISPATNALMTANIINLSTYYSRFKDVDEKLYTYSKVYKRLAKEQLNFYSEHLRNPEGVFIEKKNLAENNYKGFNLTDKNNKFKFSDQAFMMASYNLYSEIFANDQISNDYNKFSLEILQALIDFKEKIYESSFEEILKTLMAINIFYSQSENYDAKTLIIDLTDYLINKFDEKNYYVDSLDFSSLFAINLILSYRNTHIIAFKDKSKEIVRKLVSLYDNDKEVFLKLSSKKELKYSSFDIVFYFLALDLYYIEFKEENNHKNILSSLYRKYFINSGLVSSWPEAPTLDEAERYRSLTLKSEDMIEESFFRMPTTLTPLSLGIAPIFNRSVNYSKKKDDFSVGSSSFDSLKNMFIHQSIIFLFKDEFLKETTLTEINRKADPKNLNNPSIKINKENLYKECTDNIKETQSKKEDSDDDINENDLKIVEEEVTEVPNPILPETLP
ncbi:hypothetical protein [Clostridium sp.]|uniref:hypothetical protein n=1 Tax=Clostridium sp. TaxID=1506 RepID=UPI00260362F5|nr:hypothetical protein [Clostridium sp.]